MKPLCIIIAGPTAVGKTQLAIDVARHFDTEIISADSRQCYKELNIGVARPDPQQLTAVKHHFISSHSIFDTVTAADFESYALQKAHEVFEKKSIVVITGGTGLYLRAFEKGLDPIPAIQQDIRAEIIAAYELHGYTWLAEQLTKEDPIYAASGEMQNPQRMMRALEVIRSCGTSIISFQQHQPKERPFEIFKIGLELPREMLYHRINQRVDEMITAGLVDEARSVFEHRSLNALQTVGYSELFDCFDGAISLPAAIELIKQHTRNYAKRQMTWFKKDQEMNWFPPQSETVINFLSNKI